MKKLGRTLEVDSVCRHRKDDCVHYNNCLKEASAMLWQSFSCDGCEYYLVRSDVARYPLRDGSPLGWEM